MLDDHEQRVWDDVVRSWAEEAQEPARSAPLSRRRASQDPPDPPALVVAGVWATILLVIFGVPDAGLAVGVATAAGWAVWRHWPRLGGMGSATAWSVFGEVHRGSTAARHPGGGARER
ncbi:hypothetical protein ACI79C_09720 [Geodermatophilus sp. SYSU D00697]